MQLLGRHKIPDLHNTSHVIHKFSFGPHFEGMENPLDGMERLVNKDEYLSHKYYMKVVPTEVYSR